MAYDLHFVTILDFELNRIDARSKNFTKICTYHAWPVVGKRLWLSDMIYFKNNFYDGFMIYDYACVKNIDLFINI